MVTPAGGRSPVPMDKAASAYGYRTFSSHKGACATRLTDVSRPTVEIAIR